MTRLVSRRKQISLPLIGLVILALLIALVPVPSAFAAPIARTIRVEAGNFAFNPEIVHVNPGDRITIELVAKDVSHGLSIDGYPVDLKAEPGQTVRTTFVADKTGVFKLRCSIACGNLHPFMTGKFQVGENWLLFRAFGLGILAVIGSVLGGKRG